MGALRGLTYSTYGWIMAYLLPGVGTLYGMTYWSEYTRQIFDTFLTSTSNLSLLVMTLLAALTLGKLINALSALLYEGWICKNFRIDFLDAIDLKNEENQKTFQLVIDENYRYYQCLGGFSFVLPFLFGSWLWHTWGWLTTFEVFALSQLFMIGEFAVIRIALITYRNCSSCLSHLLQNEARENQSENSVVSRYEVRSKKTSGS